MRRLTLMAATGLALVTPAVAAAQVQVAAPAFGDGDRLAYIAGRLVSDDDPLDGGDVVPAPDGCVPSALGGGQLAFACYADDGATRPTLYDADERAFHDPAGLDALLDFERQNTGNGEIYSVSGVGRAMLQVQGVGNHVFVRLDFDWHLGRFVVSRRDSRRIENLDGPAGEKTLCAPVRLPRHAVADFLETVHEPEPALSNGTRVVRWWDRQLVLQRCGARRPLVLTRRMLGGPLLTARYAAWIEPGRLIVRLLSTGARIAIPIRTPDVGPSQLSGTQRRVILSSPSGAIVYTL